MSTLLFQLLLLAASTAAAESDRIHLTLDTSETEAVLALLEQKRSNQPIGDADWGRLFATEPYRRLKAREASLDRSFTDDDFKRFVLSDELAARATRLRDTIRVWRNTDLRASATRVLSYLPAEAVIRAEVYLVIKPRSNSFVYAADGERMIFFYLDPATSAAAFENTAAHELHHIGYASLGPRIEPAQRELPAKVRAVVHWLGAFGEGIAMLAAAGSPDVHPHATSAASERERWDRDLANFNSDLRSVEAFLMDVVEGRLKTEAEIRKKAFSFFGDQGPWYTVGYKMAALIEREYGRDALVACLADPRRLLATYNRAAAIENARGSPELALWSSRLLDSIGAASR